MGYRARVIVLGSLLTFGVCAFAVLRGGEAQRAAAVTALVVMFGALVAQALFGRALAWPVIGADVALSIALGVLAAIHLEAWLFVLCACAMALLVVHGVFLGTEGARVTQPYAALVNGLDLLMLATLLAATLRGPQGAARPEMMAADAA